MDARRRFRVLTFAALLALATALPASPALAGPITIKIIGGDPADTGEYPFMAAILNETISGTDWHKQFCGGTLIDDDWVLTAAHCAEGFEPAELAVAVGRTHLNSTEGQRRAVSQIHVHPSFGSPTGLSHDVALLKLASRVHGIAAITLADAADDGLEAPGTLLWTIGWGSTTAKGQPFYPDELREVQVPVVSDADCQEVYHRSLDPVTMLCAGAPGVDSCYGDSGGPLFAETGGGPVQLGTVSWGLGCAKKRFPGVYGEVNATTIRSWITTTAGV
jgi:secreted trypsin-like serine protease